MPLLIWEASTDAIRALESEDPAMLVWWSTQVECASAIARRERQGGLEAEVAQTALERLDELAQRWEEVDPAESVRRTAKRLLRVHAMRAGDALQLAAAIAASEGHPATLDFVSLDDRLIDAARREGFPVVEPTAGRD